MQTKMMTKKALWPALLFFVASQLIIPVPAHAQEAVIPGQTPAAPATQPETTAADNTQENSPGPAAADSPSSGASLMNEGPLSAPTPEENNQATAPENTADNPAQATASPSSPSISQNAAETGEAQPAVNGGTQTGTQNNDNAAPAAAASPSIQQQAAGNVSTFPGQPVITSFSNEAAISIDQRSSSEFRLNYDLTQEGSFGGAIINFGATAAGPQDLSGMTQYQFEIATNNTCPAGTPCLKVEFLDANDQLGVAMVDNLGTGFTPVTITQETLRQSNPALNFGAIKQINFVVDQPLTSADAGFFDIRAGGIAFTPTLIAQAPGAAPTQLPGTPAVSTFSNASTVTVERTSDTLFRVNYDVTAPGSFGGAIINYGESGGAQDVSGLSQFVFNLSTDNACAGSKCLKIEFVDADNNLAALNVQGLDATSKQIAISRDLLLEANAALDLTRLRQINFVIEESNTAPKAGFLQVETGGFNGTPGPGPGPEPTVPTVSGQAASASPTQFPGTPAIGTFENQGTVTLQQTSDTVFRADYTVTTPGSFGGAIIDYSGAAGGAVDLSAIQNFVFNVTTDNACGGSKCFKLEFVDANNEVAAIDVQNLSSSAPQISLTQALLEQANPDLDLTRIRQINFVIEEANTNPKTGFIQVETGGFNATPGPGPGPGPEPGGALFTGVTEGQIVSGTVIIQPDLAQTPDIRKVAYYLNGTKAGKSYDAPFVWGGSSGVDTSKLPDGEYTLTAVYTTPQGDQEFTVHFTVQNGNSNPPAPEPADGDGAVFTGITANQTVSGTISVHPDLTAAPAIHKVFYYIDGTRVDRKYEAPFTLDYDTSQLENGAHTLSILYGTTDGDFMNNGEFTLDIPFTVSNTEGAAAASFADIANAPLLQPAGTQATPAAVTASATPAETAAPAA